MAQPNLKDIFPFTDTSEEEFLLINDKHRKTKEFIDALFSLSMYPLIDRPYRITKYSATLIDNIFTNDLITDKLSGFIINDLSDHLPVFSIIKIILMNHMVRKNVLE